MTPELYTRRHGLATLVILGLMGCGAVQAQGPDPLSRPATAWQPLSADQIKAQVFAAMATMKADTAVRAKAAALRANLASSATEDDLLGRVIRTFVLVNSSAAKLAALCSGPPNQLAVPSQAWLGDGSVPPLFAHNMQLFYAQWLVHESLFDEAQEQLAGLSPGDVVAPASLLFNQSVVYRALLNKELGLKAIDELLQSGDASPRRTSHSRG